MTPSVTMFQELQWLSFTNRVQYHSYIMMFKALNGQASAYISNKFTKTSEIHDRCLRSVYNDELRVPFSRTTYFENSFTVSGAKLWNSLQIELRQISNINSFKNAVKSYLLHTDHSSYEIIRQWSLKTI